MNWENPAILLGLAILPAAAGLLLYADRRRRADATRFADAVMVPRLMPAKSGRLPGIKAVVFLLGLGLLVVAAARPRFGKTTEQPSRRSADVFLLLDVSRSMFAEDVAPAPNRLAEAKAEAKELLDRLMGDRVGLVLFAGEATLRAPLTTDHGFVREAIDKADPSLAPRGGTRIGRAIAKALSAMPKERDRDHVMVLLTDGEDHDPDAFKEAVNAAGKGVKIFTLGFGDAIRGSRIPVPTKSGERVFLEYQGREVVSRLNEDLLKAVALEGTYLPAGPGTGCIARLYHDHLAGLARTELREAHRTRYREQFQWFLGLGLILLLVEIAISRSPATFSKRGQRPAEAT